MFFVFGVLVCLGPVIFFASKIGGSSEMQARRGFRIGFAAVVFESPPDFAI